jgi:uncharacterized protein (TIGR03435 family)
MSRTSTFSSLFLLFAGTALSQQTDTNIKFEVASVRPSPPHSAPSVKGLEISGDRVHVGPIVLVNLIAGAYGVQNYQVQGPAWLTSTAGLTLFDVDAKAPSSSPRSAVLQMLQNLLAERFSLSVEVGSTDVEGRVLLVAKGGPRLPNPQSGTGNSETAKSYNGMPMIQLGGIRAAVGTDGSQHVEASNIGGLISYFTMRYAPTPFVDETGVTGDYDIKLDIPPADLGGTQPGGSPALARELELDAPTSALTRLGLRLERRKIALKAIIVRHVEKNPTEN